MSMLGDVPSSGTQRRTYGRRISCSGDDARRSGRRGNERNGDVERKESGGGRFAAEETKVSPSDAGQDRVVRTNTITGSGCRRTVGSPRERVVSDEAAAGRLGETLESASAGRNRGAVVSVAAATRVVKKEVRCGVGEGVRAAEVDGYMAACN